MKFNTFKDIENSSFCIDDSCDFFRTHEDVTMNTEQEKWLNQDNVYSYRYIAAEKNNSLIIQ